MVVLVWVWIPAWISASESERYARVAAEMTEELPLEQMLEAIPLRRIGQDEEVAGHGIGHIVHHLFVQGLFCDDRMYQPKTF